MEEYRLTTQGGKKLLYAAKQATEAKRLAESDGYRIVCVERYDIGYWIVVIGKLPEER
jgi:hypothetical protein